MNQIRNRIDFITVLVQLQALLGKPVSVIVGFRRCAGGASFESRLERVETLPTADDAVLLHFADKQLVDLAPAGLQAFAVVDVDTDTSWLEFDVGESQVLEISAAWTAERAEGGQAA